MAITRAGLGGAGRAYGAFTAKAAAGSGGPADQVTRVGLGGPARYNGPFAAKAPAAGVVEPAARRTRVGVGGPVRWWGDYTDKAAAVVPDAESTAAPGGAYARRIRRGRVVRYADEERYAAWERRIVDAGRSDEPAGATADRSASDAAEVDKTALAHAFSKALAAFPVASSAAIVLPAAGEPDDEAEDAFNAAAIAAIIAALL